MSTYQRPLQPWDPIVQDQQIKPPIRFIRDNFQGTGQDSHTQAPAQDPAMWQALTNVQPITKGVIERRWGFTQFATGLNAAANRLASFQRDSDGLRTILAQGMGTVQAFTEAGANYLNPVFNPTGSVVRSLTSRNYQYFYDGINADLQKWNGDQASGVPHVTNWGISATNFTPPSGATTYGPSSPTSAVDQGGSHPWTNPSNLTTPTGVATVTSNAASFFSDKILLTGFGFSLPANATVIGIVVTVNGNVGSGNNNVSSAFFNAQLSKAGSAYGYSANQTANIPDTFIQRAFGGPSYLWGGTWTPADINSSNFGVFLSASCAGSGGSYTFDIATPAISVFAVVPGTGVVITSRPAGNITLSIGRTYYLTFFNANTGHFSDLTSPSATTGPLTNQEVVMNLAVGNDPQITHKWLLATADGNDPSILYLVAEIPNATTSFTDNTPETTLNLNQILFYTDQTGTEYGVALNLPPPAGTIAIKHQGRIWMAGVTGATHTVFFSKGIENLTLPNGFIAGKYEEAWPQNNYFDISDGAESVFGLLSDGQTLYIGSQYHVRRVTGNSPSNFSLPEIVHPQVGVINQEVWQLVYTQGSPAGAIWLTPDFRVIQSDFNTYIDIGTKIQDILNKLQPNASQLAHAAAVSIGEYDLYVLAVPFAQTTYCDLHLIYDMRHQTWFVWQPTNGSLALLYNVTAAALPQWLFIAGVGNTINQYQASALTDNGTGFPCIAQTSWMGLTEPGHKKLINELEVSADPLMTCSIQGALTAGDFLAPKIIVTNQPSVLGPLGTLKFFVAAIGSDKYKYYQFIFQSTSTTTPIMLNSYNIEVVPISDL